MGLVTTILTFTADPFSQQLLQLVQRIEYVDELKGARATSPRSIMYDLGRSDADLSMQTAILNGMSQPKTIVKQHADVVCPTGNCSWDPFYTLGVCHLCNNLTSRLERINAFGDFFDHIYAKHFNRVIGFNATALTLPNGHFIANRNDCDVGRAKCVPIGSTSTDTVAMTSYATCDRSKTNAFQDMDTLLWSMSVIYFDDINRQKWNHSHRDDWNLWPDSSVQAMECAAYYCIKVMKNAVIGNIIQEDATELRGASRVYQELHPLDTKRYRQTDSLERLDDNDNGTILQLPLLIHYTNSSGANATYGLQPKAYVPISSFFQDMMRRNWRNGTKVLQIVKKHIPMIEEMYNGQVTVDRGASPVSLARMWNKNFTTNIEEVFENLAISMTNDLRRSGQTQPRSRGDLKPFSDFGEGHSRHELVGGPEMGKIGLLVVVHTVSWYWMSLHGVILLGSVIFCAGTIILSREVPIWKSHSLATMSQGSTIVDFGSEVKTVRELENVAKSIEVSLSTDGDKSATRSEGRQSSSS